MLSCWMECATSALATQADLDSLGKNPEFQYEVPASEQVVLTHLGIPLDEVEDLLLESAAYRQAGRVLLPNLNDVKGRPAHTAAWWTCRIALHRRNAQWSIRRRRRSSHRPLALGEIHGPLGRRGRRRDQNPARPGAVLA